MPTTTRGARHLLAGLAAAALVAGLCGVAPASAADPRPSGATPEPVLDQDLRGEEAIRALGDRLPAVAAQNDLTAAAFRAALRRDAMLWVSRTGQLLFVDELQLDPEPADAADLLASATMPAGTNVFALHSRPGAERVIVLDFDGHDARGTAWGSSPKQNAAAYSQDADPVTFDDAERAAIYSVWQRVAEDYAPFAVDVTTQDPGHGPGATGHESIRRSDDPDDSRYGTRVVITPTQAYACSCGGVAYVGVFDAVGATHDSYQPAWVFTSGVGTGAKSIAEAASHEAGHNLGLSHDGSASTGYYQGHGDWAPIMGVGYYQPISQWSSGEYQGANNREDDYAVAAENGAPMAADEAGPVEVVLGTTVHGTIGAGGDVDSFTFTSDGSPVRLAARPAAVSPDLDVRMRVLSGADTLHTFDPSLVLSDSRDVASGLDAIADLTLSAGSYTVLLDGAGWGDPLTNGYTTYGSTGRYTLTLTADGGGSGGDPEPPPPPATPPAAPSGLGATVGGPSVVLTWTDNSADETGFELQRESKHKSGSYRGTTTIPVAANGGATASATDSPGTGTFRYRVRAVRDELASGYTDWVVVEIGGGGGGRPPKAR